MAAADNRSRIAEFWRAVELFSPPPIDKVDDLRKVFRLDRGAPLPWDDEHRLAGIAIKPHLTWRHTVLLGCYQLKRMTDVIAESFGEDPESYDARLDQETAVAAFQVGADGVFQGGSAILSASAWATAQLVRGGSFAVEDFRAAQAEMQERLAKQLLPLTADDETGVELPLAVETLITARKVVVELLGVGEILAADEIRVKSITISRRRAEDHVDDFLNSFLLDDLEKVAIAARGGRCGTALRSYLSDGRPPDRIDIRHHPELSMAATQPRATPLGRWPSNPEHPLALSQQFAVNQIMSDPAVPSIYAVNGPPGTGKTTMLRDLVAGIVVRRAEALAVLGNPADAFAGTLAWKREGRTLIVRAWSPELVGHEIVVVSSNNGAVQNVTLEIPGRGAIDDRWFGFDDHFRDLASVLLRVPKDDESPRDRAVNLPEAWALVAAMLGRKKNRDRFANTVWFGEKNDDEADDDDGESPPTLRDELNAWIEAGPVESWEVCVARFRSAVAVAEKARSRRAAVFDALGALTQVQRVRRDAAEDISRTDHRIGQIQSRLRGLDNEGAHAEQDLRACYATRERHASFRPNVFRALIDRAALHSWRADDEEYASRVRNAEEHLTALRAEHAELDRALLAESDARAFTEGRLIGADREIHRLHAVLRNARAAWGDAVVDDVWWTGERRRELSAPWSDPEINEARSAVFLAALRLHHDFLTHQARAMRQNLSAAVDILTGAAPPDLDEAVARSAWQSLFFVVPVVSTTFASVGRMFSHLTAESLGWLFVDEAGQAAPQNVVGALWRCRRAVVVGDPLQLEPVVTLPFRAQQSLRLDAGVEEQWVPAGRSVQTLSDNLMPIGIHLPDGNGGSRWVGAPLRVHRRCDEPMFTVVNRIVYGGMMLSAVGPRAEFTFPDGRPMPETKWLDIPTTSSNGHWVRAEGDKLAELIGYMAKHQVDLAEVMVIGPFRDVARESKRIFTSFGGDGGGTIHTSQGKESDIVVLVLGSDPARPGARQWAASSPNLLNVAVSRADGGST